MPLCGTPVTQKSTQGTLFFSLFHFFESWLWNWLLEGRGDFLPAAHPPCSLHNHSCTLHVQPYIITLLVLAVATVPVAEGGAEGVCLGACLCWWSFRGLFAREMFSPLNFRIPPYPTHPLSLQGVTNVQGEEVKKLDLVANRNFINLLRHTGKSCVLVSEEVSLSAVAVRVPTAVLPLTHPSPVRYAMHSCTIMSCGFV